MTTIAPLPGFSGPSDTTEAKPAAATEETDLPFDAVLADASKGVGAKNPLPQKIESPRKSEIPADEIVATDEDEDDSEPASEEEEPEAIMLSSFLTAWQILPPSPPVAPQLGNLGTDRETSDLLSPSLEMPALAATANPSVGQPASTPLTPPPASPALQDPPEADTTTPNEAASIEASKEALPAPVFATENASSASAKADRAQDAVQAANQPEIKVLQTPGSPTENPRQEPDGIPVAKEHRAMTETVFQHPAKIAPAAFAEGESSSAPSGEASPETMISAASAEAPGRDGTGGGMADGQRDRPSSEAFHLPSAPDRTFEAESSVVDAPASSDTTQLIQNIERAIERMRSQGSQRMELRLPMRDGQEVVVKLRVEQGEVKASFQSDSEGLRQALEAGWSQVPTLPRTARAKQRPRSPNLRRCPTVPEIFNSSPVSTIAAGTGVSSKLFSLPCPVLRK